MIEIKTHGVDSESAIVDRIFKVYGNKNDTPLFIPAFGIYFRNINADSNEIPKHIDVVIRPVNELVDTNVLVSTPGSEREGRSGKEHTSYKDFLFSTSQKTRLLQGRYVIKILYTSRHSHAVFYIG